jgi:hypothetical protein
MRRCNTSNRNTRAKDISQQDFREYQHHQKGKAGSQLLGQRMAVPFKVLLQYGHFLTLNSAHDALAY